MLQLHVPPSLPQAQSKLEKKKHSLENKQAALKKALAAVEDERTKLQDGLKQLGNYLRSLAHIALAPPSEMEGLSDDEGAGEITSLKSHGSVMKALGKREE